jgi:hypothetical protein
MALEADAAATLVAVKRIHWMQPVTLLAESFLSIGHF